MNDFDELYRAHASAVTAAVKQTFGDGELAAEVTQVAFVQLWSGRLEEHRSHLRPWLIRVAYNAAVDRLRRKRPATLPLLEAVDRVSESPGPDEVAIMRERKRDVRAALAALPIAQRDVIELSYFRGLTQSDIAELIGEPLGTVKGRIRLGIARMRKLIATA